jgi:hypothetical protein
VTAQQKSIGAERRRFRKLAAEETLSDPQHQPHPRRRATSASRGDDPADALRSDRARGQRLPYATVKHGVGSYAAFRFVSKGVQVGQNVVDFVGGDLPWKCDRWT